MFGSGQHPMHSGTRFSLDKTCFLLVDDNPQALDILAQVVQGFGPKSIVRCGSAVEAKEILARQPFDVLLTDGQMPDMDGYELIRWLRHEGGEPNRFIPALIISGHVRLSQLFKARDCGASFTILKPITPKIVLERLFFIARDQRMFVDCGAYIGPDRRFKREGPPPGMEGRRSDDLGAEVGMAAAPNMSQEEIDAMMKPGKVML
jgi:CheY-like chemotaxis protein